MQTHGGEAARQAIENAERNFVRDVRVDWAKNGKYAHPLTDMSLYVAKATRNLSIGGTLPSELGGSDTTAAELEIVFSTEHMTHPPDGLTMVELFSDFQIGSPLSAMGVLGAEITYALGVHTTNGLIEYPQFVGNIVSVDIDRATGEVTVRALDRVEKLRKPVNMPTWGLLWKQDLMGQGWAQMPYTDGLIAMCLQQCDISATPYARPPNLVNFGEDDPSIGYCVWVGGQSSILPINGHKWFVPELERYYPEDAGNYTSEMFTRRGRVHPQATGAANTVSVRGKGNITGVSVLCYFAPSRYVTHGSGEHYFGLTLTKNYTASWDQMTKISGVLMYWWVGTYGYQDGCRLEVEWDGPNQRLRPRVSDMNGSDDGTVRYGNWVNLPTGNWTTCRLNFFWSIGNDLRQRAWVDGKPTTMATVTSYEGNNGVTDNAGGAYISDHLGFQDMYWMTRYEGYAEMPASVNYPARYPAVLDNGLHQVSYIPDSANGGEAWEVIKAAAAGEQGAVFFDESGVFRFWNYSTLLSKRESPVRYLTLDEIGDLKTTSTMDDVRNAYVVATPFRLAEEQGAAYAAGSNDEFLTAPNTTQTFAVDGSNIVAVETERLSNLPSESWNADGAGGAWNAYVPATNSDPEAADGTWSWGTWSSGHVTAFKHSDGSIIITVKNPYKDRWVKFMTRSGDAALNVAGWLLRDGDKQQVYKDADSIAKYGERALEISHDYMQFRTFARTNHLDGTVLPRTSEPTPKSESITIPGDPRIQIGDSFDIADETGLGARIRAQVVGITREFDADTGLSDTYEIELFAIPQVGLKWDGVTTRWETWDTLQAQFAKWDDVTSYQPGVGS